MQDFFFYIRLGLDHVLDFSAYDHLLFLAALSIPFTFKDWKKVFLLATIFTIAHCTSLALSVYGLMRVDSDLVEFLIPVTIFLTAFFNKLSIKPISFSLGMYFHILTTAFFGLIHGFGFSNYFNMLMSGESDKNMPLLSFAIGIELAQLIIIMAVLALSTLMVSTFKMRRWVFIMSASLVIGLVTIPMLIDTFPS